MLNSIEAAELWYFQVKKMLFRKAKQSAKVPMDVCCKRKSDLGDGGKHSNVFGSLFHFL